MKVLIVEDDASYAKALRHTLQKQGYEISFTDNGADAIKKFQTHNYDLVITDIFLPEKEGIELIQEIRDIDSSVKIIAISSGGITGHSSFLEIAEAMGANGVIKKPFDPSQIIAAISGL